MGSYLLIYHFFFFNSRANAINTWLFFGLCFFLNTHTVAQKANLSFPHEGVRVCALSLLLCLACHTSLTADNFPPILPRSQSEGSPPSLTRQGSFLSVLCRLAMCCSYSLDYLGCAKCHIRLFIFVYYLDRGVAIELRMLLSARCACGDSPKVAHGSTFICLSRSSWGA